MRLAQALRDDVIGRQRDALLADLLYWKPTMHWLASFLRMSEMSIFRQVIAQSPTLP